MKVSGPPSPPRSSFSAASPSCTRADTTPDSGDVIIGSVLGFSSQSKAGRLEHGDEISTEPQDRSPGEGGALPSLCLKQVYPKYTKQFNYLRLVERMAALFIRFLGVKGNMRLGPTAFRTFIRYKRFLASVVFYVF